MEAEDSRAEHGIAIVGMALRFPGARSTEEFWQNLSGGVESIRTLSDEELDAAGVPAADYRDPRYVRRKGVLDGADQFDARFFDLPPLEASVMDPQHRLFLECAWDALENAGYGGGDRGGRVGVYTGVGINTYWLRHVASNARAMALLGGWQASILNDKDFVPTRVSYHLDLKGPSVSVNSACSASLVAVHMACQSLLTFESDMALAGGVSVEFPQQEGVLWREGMVYAPDGHCRAFDASGGGIVDGSGVGIVVLKRLADAVRDRDAIRAVILGSAVNNDGAAKVGYTAPSIEGQVDVIRQALAMAGCSAEDIGYVEAHGTATALGDPIEVAALTQAFRDSTTKRRFCALGSVKTNLGHLDTAAGVAGLIKTVLCLQHRAFVPSLHYRKPNPHIAFDESPFYVSTEHRTWPDGPGPRRAGVTSLGIGGTNAHVVVQEPPAAPVSEAHRRTALVVLSAKTEPALSAAEANLAAAIERGQAELADVAYTLQVGRREFDQRRMMVASSSEELLTALRQQPPKRSARAFEKPPGVVFLFPGQGAQHPQMSREIYDTEPVYRREVDRQSQLLRARRDLDPRPFIFAEEPDADARLRDTAVAQPALFVVEYALARLWASWGIEPDVMVGHSVGELVAACLSGVLELEDALVLVAVRGALMARAPEGAMLAVHQPASELADRLMGGLAIAAINEPDWCVASGSVEAVSELEGVLAGQGIDHRRLRTSHAFHSPAMDGVVEPFVREVARCKLGAPRVPFISNVTGTYIEAARAMSPSYWGQQLRQTVRFAQGLGTLLGDGAPRTFIEVGPGHTLSTMVDRHPQKGDGVAAISSLPPAHARASAHRHLLEAAGQLWLRGHRIDWQGFHADDKLGRVPLPSYPFERRRHWIDSSEVPAREAREPRAKELGRGAALAHDAETNVDAARLWVPSWTRRSEPLVASADVSGCWLLVLDRAGCGDALARALRAAGADVCVARSENAWVERSERDFGLDAACPSHLQRLVELLQSRGVSPRHVVHLAGLDGTLELGAAERWAAFGGLAALLGALERLAAPPARLTVVARGGHAVTGDEALSPQSAAAHGLVRAAGLERRAMLCRSVDVSERELERVEWLGTCLLAEAQATAPSLVAYRGRHRWEMTFEEIAPIGAPPHGSASPGTAAGGGIRSELGVASATRRSGLRPGGKYVVIGGHHGVGGAVVRHLCQVLGSAPMLIEASNQVAAEPPADPSRPAAAERSESPVLQACVEDGPDLARCIRVAAQRLGGLDGVVYAAAIDDAGLLGAVGDLPVHTLAAVLERHERALCALEHALHGQELDFCYLFSSLRSMVGGVYGGAHGASHQLRDSVVRRHNQRGGQAWTLVSFDRWLEGPSPGRCESGPVEAALRALERLARSPGLDHVLVAAGDLAARLERAPGDADGAPGLQPSAPPEARAGLDPHPAPVDPFASERTLSTPYVEPRDELERGLAAIWQELLGIGRVGVEDDFFDLGGHSLLATRFLVRLEERLGLRLTIADFFAHPTVAELALACRHAAGSVTPPSVTGSEDLEELLTQMERMSESEARAGLQAAEHGAEVLDELAPSRRR